MKYYVIAGEASGDLHGANLIRALKKRDQEAEFRCWGGELIQEAAGTPLVEHYRNTAFMGFVEVVKNLRTILQFIRACKEDLVAYAPDVLILIDYPGFNLRIADFAKKQGLRVFYYISPQIWAWNTGRVHKIKKMVDRMFVILPFERDFYQKWNVEVDFVGHPLLDAVEADKAVETTDFYTQNGLEDKPIVALLPGSRQQEIKRMLPIMLEMIAHFPTHQFVIAGASAMEEVFYQEFIGDSAVKMVKNQTYGLLRHAKAALVTSGTATLETALYKVPQVVCYKGNALSYQLGKRLVKVKYISLVNLILDRGLVKELIQDDLHEETLKNELALLLEEENYRATLLEGYRELADVLGGAGASGRVADLMVGYLL